MALFTRMTSVNVWFPPQFLLGVINQKSAHLHENLVVPLPGRVARLEMNYCTVTLNLLYFDPICRM